MYFIYGIKKNFQIINIFLSKILKPREENEWKQKPWDRELHGV